MPLFDLYNYKQRWFYVASGWMNEHWEVPIFFCVLYCIMLKYLPQVMKDRPAFRLKGPLVAWNLFLALFSLVGAVYTVQNTINAFRLGGLDMFLCSGADESQDPWVFLFCVSKIPELIDTLFLILRKREVIFLHWYHHLVTLLYCWWGWSSQTPSGGSFAVMNLVVHSVMYSYYGIMAAGIRIPLSMAKPITAMQITQMVLGFLCCGYAFLRCEEDGLNQQAFNVAGCLMYISYAWLFVEMATRKYSEKEDKQKKDKEDARKAAAAANTSEADKKKE